MSSTSRRSYGGVSSAYPLLTASWVEHTIAEAGGAAFITPEPEDARIWFFTRKGGVSKPPYDGLNISTRVGDNEDAVLENRSRVETAMGNRPSARVRQVAGDGVAWVEEPGFAGEADARGSLTGLNLAAVALP